MEAKNRVYIILKRRNWITRIFGSKRQKMIVINLDTNRWHVTSSLPDIKVESISFKEKKA
jgi:hypothetical protein